MRYTIGEAAGATESSPDTLRYYEKIGLLPKPARTSAGRRVYGEPDLARLRFVRRAQSIGFSLEEIRQLLRLRQEPHRCSRQVRGLAAQKCSAIEVQMKTLEQIHRELTLLLNLCRGDNGHCPILERLEAAPDRARPKGTIRSVTGR